jgi:hypothetical protein
VGLLRVVFLQAGIGTCTGQAVRDGLAVLAYAELVAVDVVIPTRVV